MSGLQCDKRSKTLIKSIQRKLGQDSLLITSISCIGAVSICMLNRMSLSEAPPPPLISIWTQGDREQVLECCGCVCGGSFMNANALSSEKKPAKQIGGHVALAADVN